MERKSLPSAAAVCGLYCEGCSLFIATNDDPERLKRIAAMYGMTEEQVSCRGCRSDKHGPYCASCAMKPCAEEHGVDFCGECPQYPCPTLEDFQAERPHRRDLWKDLDRIREVGWVMWSKEVRKEYECPRCGAINSAYDLKCRSCGREPSCGYVARHGDALRDFPAKK